MKSVHIVALLTLFLLSGCIPIPFSSSSIDELCSQNGSTLVRINESWSCLPINTNLTNASLDTRYYVQQINYSTINLAFNQSRKPSTTKPTFVVTTVAITVDDSASTVADDGEVIFELSNDNASWTAIGSWRANIQVAVSTSITLKQSPTLFIVPTNMTYRLRPLIHSGNPLFNLSMVKELEG